MERGVETRAEMIERWRDGEGSGPRWSGQVFFLPYPESVFSLRE